MALPTRLVVLQRPEQPLHLVCAKLRGWGFHLRGCASGTETIGLLVEDGADIVLIDAGAADAVSLVSQLKADPVTRCLPVVIATAEDYAVVAAHALALGADDIFLLPIEDGELYARIRALSRLAAMELERRRRESVLAEFGVHVPAEPPGMPAIDRIAILLIGPAGGDQIQV
ncbi:MAG: response regulator, partial [Geminicoccaceae bacterium]